MKLNTMTIYGPPGMLRINEADFDMYAAKGYCRTQEEYEAKAAKAKSKAAPKDEKPKEEPPQETSKEESIQEVPKEELTLGKKKK
jgi:hypothetical protein